MPHHNPITAAAIEVFNRCAQQYEDKFMDVSSYAVSLDIVLQSVDKETASVLDVACGPGNISRYLQERKRGWEILGIDLAPDMLQLAQHNLPSARFKQLDARSVKTLEENFDVIIIGFCTPYLAKDEVLQLIADCADCLLPGGVLYLSTMEDKYERSGWETSPAGNTLYLYYHEYDYLKNTLLENKLEIVHERRQPYERYTDLILVARK